MHNITKEKLIYWLKLVVVALVTVFIIRGFILIPMKVEGNSMEQTLHPNDFLVYEKISEIKRFDVIIFEAPDHNIYIKRVIGLPGEHIAYLDDQLYINDKKIDEPFLGQAKIKRNSNQYTTNFNSEELLEQKTLSEDAYFVLGDNRRLSKDSRSFGEVKESTIIGKARFVYYPFSHIKWM